MLLDINGKTIESCAFAKKSGMNKEKDKMIAVTAAIIILYFIYQVLNYYY